MKTEFIAALDSPFVSSLICETDAGMEAFAKTKQLVKRFDKDFTYERFTKEATRYLSFRRREELEKNPAYRQLIPILILINDDKQVYTYQRGKLGDEGRIAGKGTVNVGGHVEIYDHDAHKYHEDNSGTYEVNPHVDTYDLLANAARRERHQEVRFVNAAGEKIGAQFYVKEEEDGSKTLRTTAQSLSGAYDIDEDVRTSREVVPYGLLIDNADEVGTVHLGIVYLISHPNHAIPVSNEDVIEDLGQFSLAVLNARADELKLEPWARMIVRDLLETQV